MAVNSKQKGNTFERDVCAHFERIFGGTFKRVPQSGAFGTVNSAVLNTHMKETLTGDIICPEGFRFSVECKSYKSIPWHHIVAGSCKQLDKWIGQSEKDAILAGKDALIVFKIVRQGIFMVFDTDVIDEMITELPTAMIKYQDKIIISLKEFERVYKPS